MSGDAAAMSVAGFMEWNPGDGRRWQLVDGVPVHVPLTSVTHGALWAETGTVIGNYLCHRGSAWQVVSGAGIVPRVFSDTNMRVADLSVAGAPIGDDATFLSDPVAVVEILSPEDEAETWANVWAYTTIPSVMEILILHTSEIRADLLRRGHDGAWPDAPLAIIEGDVMLDSIGFASELRALYRTTRLAR